MDKGILAKLALYGLGQMGIMLTFPIWFPFFAVYMIIGTPLRWIRNQKFSRLEWLVFILVGLILSRIM